MDFITKPFGWLMMVLYEFTKSYGLAVIIFALVVKLILLPFQAKSKHSMMRTSRLQPKMKELEKKHGANKQKYNEEVAKLYREEKINPMSGCLWSLLPFPIIIALFYAIRQPLTTMMGVPKALLAAPDGAIYKLLEQLGGPTANGTYLEIHQAEFISRPEHFNAFQQLSDKLHQIDYHFLGVDLGQQPDWQFLWKANWSDPSVWVPGLLLFLLPIISGVLAYFSSKVSMQINPVQGNAQQQSSTKSMMLMMPLISIFFGFSMPGAIGVYMIAQTVLSVVQDVYLTKRYTRIMDAEDAVKLEQQRVREAEMEAKRIETERKKLENKTEVNRNTSKKKQQKAERQEQLEKSVEWEKKNAPPEVKDEPGRIETRRYARGRAYDPERFDGEADGNTPEEEPAEPAAREEPAEIEAADAPDDGDLTVEEADGPADDEDDPEQE
ncbi:YidC/Oxa1 family membrane protein insertase [Sporobacter termitidis DSM 10068]|uniref:YidC/Oxa1 family membrane protein insertase n=1 Tax=Sporobacter termitidis DSM 10068 TaxID=1123282 RepID=A0A1M5YMF0_9FIRM|nr:YidC/Oxa1 family membrane protein insertase [Sporobacter termitidis]SHI13166.1 YidC/Oxa1 family membrane protein insertase [Sporobacter termitidis DSM 10068]